MGVGVEVKQYYIETKDTNKKGNPISIPITVRKLVILGDFIVTDQYQVTLVKRHGEISYSVKYLAFVEKKKWPCPLIDKKEERKWKRVGSFSEENIRKWLKPFVNDVEVILSQLKTAPPDNIAA